ncbi:MAG TPA: tail fiber domain-containing protein [Saprospiraceae bacterium]|nr:tail fiber domain-containing protein [Saprospiraceae bacterium]
MKRTQFIIMALFLAHLAAAQAPQALNYQGVARNQSGTPLANQNIQLRLSVLAGSTTGGIVYQERHNVQTNTFGLYNLLIGTGIVTNGSFAQIAWHENAHYLKVEIDPSGGNSFMLLGTPTLLASVPYALEAAHAGQTELAGDVSGASTFNKVESIQNRPVSSTTPTTGQVLKWDGSQWKPSADATSAGNPLSAGTGIQISGNTISNTGDLDETNEIQVLSIAGNQLTISQGNTITLPAGGGGGSFSLPYNGNANNSNALFKITNTGTGGAIYGITNGSGEAAVVGEDPTGGLAGVRGYSSSSYGVLGYSDSGIGVLGQSGAGKGVVAQSSSSTGTALQATNLFGGKALDVTGTALFNDGVYIGSAEYIKDGGTYEFEFQGSLRPMLNSADDLGKPSTRWRTVYATNGVINTSDATLKRDIKPLNYGVKDLMKLQPVSYQWIDGRPGEGRIMGFLAQDLQKVIPEVVRDKEWVYEKEDRSTGHWQPAAKLGVAYSEIIPVTVAAIQEQQKQIEALRAEIENLKKQMETIKKQ